MQIIYITTSLYEEDYPIFQKSWTISLNPSNQNFHNKMIRSISDFSNVIVISLRPYSRKQCLLKNMAYETKTIDNVVYHYLPVSKNRLLRSLFFKRYAKKIINTINLKETILMSDTINPKAITVANFLKKRYHLPLIGVCTDSPSNISNTARSYTLYLLRQSRSLDGYISLTQPLNDLFNIENKPRLIIEGLVENTPLKRKDNNYGQYFFFGGALLAKYGIYELINAFKMIKRKDISLLICGHHEDKERLKKEIGNDERIQFLGILPIKEVLQLESAAIANINPRPFSEDLDRFSIPSKTIEYLMSGVPTISVRNTILKRIFEDDIIWSHSSNIDDLYKSMEIVINMSIDEREEIGNRAQKKVIEMYSLKCISKKINIFLQNFIH